MQLTVKWQLLDGSDKTGTIQGYVQGSDGPMAIVLSDRALRSIHLNDLTVVKP